MSRADRARWMAARSLTDLGELVALWLEGGIASQPGYQPRSGPDPETQELIPTLALLNRAGYITSSSQPGEAGEGDDGAHWEQAAAVEGFADHRTAVWFTRVLAGTRFEMLTSPVRDASKRGRQGVAVTTRNGEPITWFGHQLGADEIRFLYDDCHPDMIAVLCAALQVTIYDPEPGRNELWPLLHQAATARPQPAQG